MTTFADVLTLFENSLYTFVEWSQLVIQFMFTEVNVLGFHYTPFGIMFGLGITAYLTFVIAKFII